MLFLFEIFKKIIHFFAFFSKLFPKKKFLKKKFYFKSPTHTNFFTPKKPIFPEFCFIIHMYFLVNSLIIYSL
jgi:hypothetical protein